MKAKKIKCFWKCSYWLQGRQQISPTNWGRKRESLRNGSREEDGWRIDSCQFSKKFYQKTEGGMAALLWSLLVLMLESVSSQAVTMDRKNSYESLTLEMLFFHRGEVDCRITESWVLCHGKNYIKSIFLLYLKNWLWLWDQMTKQWKPFALWSRTK